MFHDIQLSADKRQLIEAYGTRHADLLSAARQQRAEFMRDLVAARIARRRSLRVRPMAIVLMLAGSALLLAYDALLSPAGLMASALTAVLFAATFAGIGGIAGFAGLASCGVVLLHMTIRSRSYRS